MIENLKVVTDLRLLDGKLQYQRATTMGVDGATWISNGGEWEDVPEITQASLDTAKIKSERRAKAFKERNDLVFRIGAKRRSSGFPSSWLHP